LKEIKILFDSSKNKAYISRVDISLLFGVTPNRIVDYDKGVNFANPLKRAPISTSRKVFYDLLYAIDWYNKNIKVKHKKSDDVAYVTKDGDEEVSDNTIINSKNMRQVKEYEEAKRARVIRQKETFDLMVKKGEYIMQIGRLNLRKNQIASVLGTRNLEYPMVFIFNEYSPEYMRVLIRAIESSKRKNMVYFVTSTKGEHFSDKVRVEAIKEVHQQPG